MMNPETDHRVDPVQYLRMVWRRKWIVVLCAVTVLCGTLVRLEFVPDEFESTASIMVDDRQLVAGQLGKLMSGMGDERGGFGLDARRFEEIRNRILSRPFLERVVRLLRVHEDPSVRRRAEGWIGPSSDLGLEEAAIRVAIADLREKISFSMNGKTVLRVRVTDSSPQNAQLLAKWISELYVDSRAQRALRDLNEARDFGEQQLAIYEERLSQAENALEEFDRQMIEEDLTGGAISTGNVNAAEALYRTILDETEAVRMRALAPQTTLAASSLSTERRAVLDDPRVQVQARGLASALVDEVTNRLLAPADASEWPPATGSYVTLRRGLLQLIERLVDSNYAEAPAASRAALTRYTFTTVDREAQSAASEFLGQEIARFRQRQQRGPRGELERARLQSEVATAQSLLESFQAQLVAANVNQAVTASDMGIRIEILDPAQLPLSPSAPDRARMVLAALLMGPFLGVVIAFALELLDPTLRSLDDFTRAFNGPVLGTAPLVMKSARIRSRSKLSYLVPGAIGLVVALTVGFFATRDAIFSNLDSLERPVQLVDPEEGQFE